MRMAAKVIGNTLEIRTSSYALVTLHLYRRMNMLIKPLFPPKVEYYKGSLRALDEEIQQTRLNMKRKQLQLKLAKQNQDLAEIESIASDLQDKMVDLHSTKEAIRDAVQTTSTNIHRLGMTGNPSPGQQVKQVGMVVDSLAANQNAAMDSLTRVTPHAYVYNMSM
eukprot:1394443-Amorphochlora_amoeboformis.AAC.1